MNYLDEDDRETLERFYYNVLGSWSKARDRVDRILEESKLKYKLEQEQEK